MEGLQQGQGPEHKVQGGQTVCRDYSKDKVLNTKSKEHKIYGWDGGGGRGRKF
jgi:hypothetical protein